MTDICKPNVWVNDGLSIGIQVTLIFVFLTVFFFSYVSKVEEEEFGKQMDIIADSIMDDVDDHLSDLVTKSSTIGKDNANIMINGILDLAQEKVVISTKKSVQDVLDKNNAVRFSAFSYLVIACLVIVVISAVLIMVGFCIPMYNNVRTAVIAVFFVAITELVFLKVIAARFISADPNKVKRDFGSVIVKWVDQNKKE